MTYQRVAPRDLFNEANFMKCLGQLALFIHDGKLNGVVFDEGQYGDHGIQMTQNESGDLCLESPLFRFKKDERAIEVFRPLNSREAWPLLTLDRDEERIRVFDKNGEITPEFNNLVAQANTWDAF